LSTAIVTAVPVFVHNTENAPVDTLADFVGYRHGSGRCAGSAPLRGITTGLVKVLGRTAPAKRKALLVQLSVFAGVGGVLNIVYALLYVVLREWISAQWSNALALVLSTIAGTWAHRRVTFGVRSRARTVPHQTLGLALLAFGLAVTAGSLQLLEARVAEPSRVSELLVLAAANLGVGLVRFGAFRVAMVPQRGDEEHSSRA
jgi:putative flippase GtrA